jgi:hypothetical protein
MAAIGKTGSRSIREIIPMIKGSVTLENDRVKNILPAMVKSIKESFTKNGRLLASYLKQERFTGGTTESKLGVRSGRLRSSVKTMPVVSKTDYIEGGTEFGTVYGRVHVGTTGQVTTIRAKKGKFLAIPLDAAKTPGGVPKGSPMGGPWGDTFFARSKEGKLILFGKSEYSKGAKAGLTHGKITPLFLMVKQVKVKARIHLNEIVDYITPKIVQDLTTKGITITKE